MTIQIRFPTDIAYGSTGGAIFSTNVTSNVAGYEKRNQQWQNPRCAYNVAHGIKNKAQLDELIAFFRAHKGRAKPFRFKDFADFQGIGEQIGVGNGTQLTFQLIKTYITGSLSDIRTINKPVDSSVKIYFGSTLQTTGYSVNYETGIITFTTPPTTGIIIKADFEFDVWVRFDTDQINVRLDDDGVFSWNEIPLVEVKL
jgi:uncharacterized protein (TIGR02217 family)